MLSEVNKVGTQAHNRLFVIGNGFDLAHGLPTRFAPDFKEIAIKNESDDRFWDLYQSENSDIWSDFESLLAKPDFDGLGEIFEAYAPDYLSDHERDRTSIIIQTDISGNLNESLDEFASNAENKLASTNSIKFYRELLSRVSYYLSFNYTHTLEMLYEIPTEQVIHIHGEVGENSKLILGYDAKDFNAGIISEDITRNGQFRSIQTSEYIADIEDYYIRTAYEELLSKIQSWEKPIQTNKLLKFIEGVTIDEVIVIGFSFGKVDAAYFELLQQLYPDCSFIISAHDKENADKYRESIDKNYPLKNYKIMLLNEG